uniref:PH domain-containing protein n=1 Tax=Parascaris univalens TaxID=6257 RepID=A0A915C6U5_PARUN
MQERTQTYAQTFARRRARARIGEYTCTCRGHILGLVHTRACRCTDTRVPHTHAHVRTFKYTDANARMHTHNLHRCRLAVMRFGFFRIAWKGNFTNIVQGTSTFTNSKEVVMKCRDF